MDRRDFYNDIEKFNANYKIQSNEAHTLLDPQRIRDFHSILSEEVDEGLELAEKYEKSVANGLSSEEVVDVLTEMSDWLGDLVVYCASEARRWGVPLPKVLEVIMESNFSKLGADGLPIYDERGKVLKGPNYWKPEPKIRELLQGMSAEQDQ